LFVVNSCVRPPAPSPLYAGGKGWGEGPNVKGASLRDPTPLNDPTLTPTLSLAYRGEGAGSIVAATERYSREMTQTSFCIVLNASIAIECEMP
jgi:hypothetical protein